MRNLRSCIKVAIDFVSPEGLAPLRSMAEELRTCALHVRTAQLKAGTKLDDATDFYYSDKLQGALMILGGAVSAWAVVNPQDCEGLTEQRDRIHPCCIPQPRKRVLKAAATTEAESDEENEGGEAQAAVGKKAGRKRPASAAVARRGAAGAESQGEPSDAGASGGPRKRSRKAKAPSGGGQDDQGEGGEEAATQAGLGRKRGPKSSRGGTWEAQTAAPGNLRERNV